MSILSTIQHGIRTAVVAAGDAIVDVQVAGSIELDAQPGQDYEPTWVMYDGKGFFERATLEDYPETTIESNDRSLVLLECVYDVSSHDYVRVGDDVFHVHAVKPDVVGTTRVLQRLLVRIDRKAGIPWESPDLSAT